MLFLRAPSLGWRSTTSLRVADAGIDGLRKAPSLLEWDAVRWTFLRGKDSPVSDVSTPLTGLMHLRGGGKLTLCSRVVGSSSAIGLAICVLLGADAGLVARRCHVHDGRLLLLLFIMGAPHSAADRMNGGYDWTGR